MAPDAAGRVDSARVESGAAVPRVHGEGVVDDLGEQLDLVGGQGRFIRYLLYVLVDLTVLNLFVEYWDRIVIDSFTISLLTPVLLQVLLKATLAVEHRIGGYFRARSGPGALVLRVLATWALLFGSKFVILEIVDIVFGDRVDFGGLIAFILLVVALLAAEKILPHIYHTLG